MIIFLSPAKTLDFDNPQKIGNSSRPIFIDEAAKINAKLKKLSRKKLTELQGISAQLASLNYNRNQQWNTEHNEGVKQAVLSFKGDVYQGLKAEEWTEEQMDYANSHLRILSGLYGILKPSDQILPYRLEMGTPLKVGRRDDLYAFWADKIKSYFKETIPQDELLINLASIEYFKAVQKAGVKNPVLDIEFKAYSNGKFKIVSFFAKKARGMMARYIIDHQIDNPEDLKAFDTEGYYFSESESSSSKYVFLRDKP